MSDEGAGLPVVRVKFGCANVEEFRRKFETNLLAKGMLARTPQMHEVGRRVLLRLELQDGSLGVDEEAVVQALEWTGGKQAMRLQLLRAKGQPSTKPTPAPSPAAAAPRSQVTGPPARMAAAGPVLPAAITDFPPKASDRARTDTETTKAMSLDELLNALPPTAKPKLTPSGGIPHLNGAVARPAAPAPPPAQPPVTAPPAPVASSVSTATTAPAPVINFENIEPPPAIRPMTPMFPMETPFAQAPLPPATPTPSGNGYSRSSISSTVELSDSIRGETIPPAPADLAVTAFNTATETTTANNATVAVPGLASQVKEAKRRGGIFTLLLLLAAISGGGAYLWRTGLLGAHAPEIAARLPPSPASTAQQPAASTTPTTPTTPAAPATAPAAKPPPATATATPTPPAPAKPTAETATAAAPEEIKLSITATPAGVKVQADGAQIGVAPLELTWPSGKPVKLRFSKPGFKSTTRAFTPRANGTLEVELQQAESDELKDVY